MPGLGNAWHLPSATEPRGCAGMRVPEGPVVPGTRVRIVNGNQFRGPGNVGDQFADGSVVLLRAPGAAEFAELPMTFLREEGNNKFFEASWQVPAAARVGDFVEYYLRIRYGDHDDTFLHAGPAQASASSGDEAVAQASPFQITLASAADVGRWGPTFPMRNVAIHASVLPNGLVLMWGRRDAVNGPLDRVQCTPWVWDPVGGPADTGVEVGPTAVPTVAGTAVNLFCSGHAFLADGRLLVVGGHIEDSVGTDTTLLYTCDPAGGVGSWNASTPMQWGRWYPSVLTMPDGGALVVSGSYQTGTNALGDPVTQNNKWPRIWRDGGWITINPLPNGQSPELYPRMHLRGRDGAVFISGPQGPSWWFTLPGGGNWTPGPVRVGARRDYAPAATFAPDRVAYFGGGTDKDVNQPTAEVEVIDLRDQNPVWRKGTPMSVPRRQHNATILPDGTVLITGGTRGPGDAEIESDPGFNDLRSGQPVHRAALWDPGPDPGPDQPPGLPIGSWTELSSEDEDRCYHATAVLLPDGRVLSAGGGEFRPRNGRNQPPNDPLDTHRTAQIFSPPYLFAGPRPRIIAAPTAVVYGQQFNIEVDDPATVARVTWIRLPSVTHADNMNQRFDELDFTTQGGLLRVSAPASPMTSPPGHHMMFVLTAAGVPSEATIVAVDAPPGVVLGDPAAPAALRVPTADPNAPVTHDTRRPLPAGALRVVVGITGTCPYGIAACWGGADEALRQLTGVYGLDPYPDSATSTAVVHLRDGHLPELQRWPDELAASANGSYTLHGTETSLTGKISERNGELVLDSGQRRPPVRLRPLRPDEKVQRNVEAGTPAEASEAELRAHQQLEPGITATVTGPLTQGSRGYELAVRLVMPV